METLASIWSQDLCDPVCQSRFEGSTLWDSQCVQSSGSCAMWTELSPHFQRNKLLQDTLVQREEELARLQEENQKLRQFLSSSFVKDLEEKAKKLCVNGRRKRNSSSSGIPISKRVCRNLTAEFCSESESSKESDQSLDLWVLKTLGLKDKDTIDTSTENNIPVTDHFQSPIEACSTICNAFHTPITANTLQTVPCLSDHHETNDGFENSCLDFQTSQEFSSPCPHSQTAAEQEYLHRMSPNTFFTTESCSFVRNCSTPLQTTISYNPLKRLNFTYTTPKKSGTNQSDPDVPSLMRSPCGPGTPHSRPVLAFSMSLSPNHSLKTHSYPHGQAFVRRDTKGRCSFTWVPQDRP